MKKLLQKLFFFDEWSLGRICQPIWEIKNQDFKVSWLENPSKIKFRADPFLFEISEKKYIIFEEYSQILKRGRIALGELVDNKIINEKIIIDDKKHLSYPYIFIDNNEIFLTCESYKSKKLILYKINKTSLEPQLVREIFTRHEAIDPTLLKFDNKYWLFYSRAQNPNRDLYLAFADSLFDDFVEHPKNPVKSCVKSSRSAGTPFIVGGEIYRPAQNCEKFYGEKIIINKINILNEKDFEEEFSYEILPPKNHKNIIGIHTISALENLTIIDGFKKRFVLYKPLISLYRNLKKVFRL